MDVMLRGNSLLIKLLCLLCSFQLGLSQLACPESNETRLSWLVLSKNTKDPISLSCLSPDYYPFCAPAVVKAYYWRFPKSLLQVTLGPGEKRYGWKVSDNGVLLTRTNETSVPIGMTIEGIYECLALAVQQTNISQMSWYHLQWALDVFASERMLMDGSFLDRFGRHLITGTAAAGVFLLVAAMCVVISKFSFAARKRRSDMDEYILSPVVESRYNSTVGKYGDFQSSYIVEST